MFGADIQSRRHVVADQWPLADPVCVVGSSSGHCTGRYLIDVLIITRDSRMQAAITEGKNRQLCLPSFAGEKVTHAALLRVSFAFRSQLRGGLRLSSHRAEERELRRS